MEVMNLNPKIDRGQTFYREMVALAGVSRGNTVVDLGCGAGRTIAPIADVVGPSGRIIAVDNGACETIECDGTKMLDVVRSDHRAIVETGQLAIVDTNLEYGIPLEDASCDIVICQDVMDWIADPLCLISECRRILRSGGALFLSNHDFGSTIFNSSHRHLNRRILDAFLFEDTEWQGKVVDGAVARRLLGFVRQLPFSRVATRTEIMVDLDLAEDGYGAAATRWVEKSARDAGIPSEQIRLWKSDLEALAQAGQFYFAMNWVYVRAEK